MSALGLSPHDLVAVRDVATPTATVALRVDDDGIEVVSEHGRRRPAVVVTGPPRPARRVADELARSLGAHVSYVDEATACAAALQGGELLLHWATRLSLSFAGRSATAFGHLGVDPDGLPCACGGRGCLQERVGAAALVAQFAAVSGQAIAIGELVVRARDRDPVADRLLGHAATLVARQLAPICAAAAISRIALAGPLSEAGAHLCDRLREELARVWTPPVDIVSVDPHTVLHGALTIARRG